MRKTCNYDYLMFAIFSVPGSITSTLDTNKYKFLTKISLDDLEIVKCKFSILLVLRPVPCSNTKPLIRLHSEFTSLNLIIQCHYVNQIAENQSY